MNTRRLVLRSLRFHWRSHLGVVLGVAIGSAALIGAMVVGDSVRGSLRERALERLGWVEAALDGGDRFFTQKFAEHVAPINRSSPRALNSWNFDAVLKLPGTASRQDGAARANQVNILGVGYWSFWQPNRLTNARPAFALIPKGGVVLNAALAAQLRARPGDEIVLRLRKPAALSADAPISPKSDNGIALRLKVHGIATASYLGDFSLRAGQTPPLNAFLLINDLAPVVGLPGKANLILAGDFRTSRTAEAWWLRGWHWIEPRLPGHRPVSRAMPATWTRLTDWRMTMTPTLADYALDLRPLTNPPALELRSERIFLEPGVVLAALGGADRASPTNAPDVHRTVPAAQPALAYLVNLLRAGTNTTPYSMVTAAGAPWTPPDMRDDEILVSQWLADDLRLKPGDKIALSYFNPESGARLTERTNTFRVRGVVPMELPWADRTLIPDFPGIEKAESTAEWDTAFPLVYKIRDQDEAYWRKYRGTPKAFVTLAAGQRMWGNRFGNLTAIRFPIPTNRVSEGGVPRRPNVKSQSDQGVAELRPPTGRDDFRAALDAKILANLKPEELGLHFEPVREQALQAAEQSQDFGGLFLGFSFFLIAAALLLMALLFQFGVEQRVTEVGTLLALGFPPRQVRRLWRSEGAALAFLGGVLGAVGGLGYAWLMLRALATVWRDAVGGSTLSFHASAATLFTGLLASTVVAVAVIWLTLRKLGRQPARALLAGELKSEVRSAKSGGSPQTEIRRVGWRAALPWLARGTGVAPSARDGGDRQDACPTRSRWLPPWRWLAILGAVVVVACALACGDTANAEAFFSAGTLMLLAGLGFLSARLKSRAGVSPAGPRRSSDRRDAGPTLGSLAWRGMARRRNRSVATVALLACGSFLIASIGVFRLDADRDSTLRSSGNGGFALIGESTLPIVHDLNTPAGRDFLALTESELSGVNFTQFRVHSGDEANCLNLNHAQQPRLLGVKPEALEGRFTFVKGAGWRDLVAHVSRLSAEPSKQKTETGRMPVLPEIPAIGDAASIQWAMGKSVGDTIDYVDEQGRPFKVRIVGALANSILQGSLVIDEAEFVKRFPSASGYRFFLVDAPTNRIAAVSAALSRSLQDYGLEVTPAARRLAQFNAVQNTYLGTFQVLGGLGLLLGSAGLGIVVLRNVLERRGELAVLLAVGWRRRDVARLVLTEHAVLLALGLAIGVFAAAVAVLPAVLSPGAPLPWATLLPTLAGVVLTGALATWLATRWALRGNLLAALRNE